VSRAAGGRAAGAPGRAGTGAADARTDAVAAVEMCEQTEKVNHIQQKVLQLNNN
jgi:hypothetical protein